MVFGLRQTQAFTGIFGNYIGESMGEAKRRSLSRDEILAKAVRCVYCSATSNLTLEHMPPRGLFENRMRPSGWEFAACERCNQGTRGADAVALFIAKIEAVTREQWKLEANLKLRSGIEKYAPGVWQEMFDQNQWSDAVINRKGILHRSKITRLDGRLTKEALDTFSAKSAMAAFHNFTGRPMELSGIIFTEWFLNAGMSQEVYDSIVKILPMHDHLKQGRKNSGRQFSLRYNSNNKNIVAALFSFHESFFIQIIATDGPEFVGPLSDILGSIKTEDRPTINICQPGLQRLISKQTL